MLAAISMTGKRTLLQLPVFIDCFSISSISARSTEVKMKFLNASLTIFTCPSKRRIPLLNNNLFASLLLRFNNAPLASWYKIKCSSFERQFQI